MDLLERPLRRLARSRLVAAVTWPHGVDRYAELLVPTWSLDGVRARVAAIQRPTADTVTVTLRPNANWQGHQPGQHVVLTAEIDGVRHHRCFSVASAAQRRDVVELTCKVGPASVVARHLRERLAVGDVVELSQARGEFVLPPVRPPAVALLSGGSGITPVMSMLRTLADEGYDGEVVFVHYARTGADLLYPDEVRALAGEGSPLRARVLHVTEGDDTGDLTGRFTSDHLVAAGIDPTRFEAFTCGPAPFMAAVAEAWRAGGGAGQRFHTESFTLAAVVGAESAGPEATGTVRFARSGVSVANDGRPLLLQAEAAGLAPAHGCRMGICHTCVRPKTSGCVRDAVTGDLDADEGTTIRICVSVPVGDVDLDL